MGENEQKKISSFDSHVAFHGQNIASFPVPEQLIASNLFSFHFLVFGAKNFLIHVHSFPFSKDNAWFLPFDATSHSFRQSGPPNNGCISLVEVTDYTKITDLGVAWLSRWQGRQLILKCTMSCAVFSTNRSDIATGVHNTNYSLHFEWFFVLLTLQYLPSCMNRPLPEF